LWDPKDRFTNRAVYYARFRPKYPEVILSYMAEELGFSNSSIVADIGSGTGILSELFLKNGNPVLGVEPNGEMRKAAEALLTEYPSFRSVNGSAEATALPNQSVDFITAAQSFHWFNPTTTRKEFLRILKPHGWVVLIWNTRRDSSPFMQAYNRVVNAYANEAHHVKHEDVSEETIRNFLGQYKSRVFDNHQLLNFEGLVGRLLSSSYAPLPGDSTYRPMMEELRGIYESNQRDGIVRMEYDTQVYSGQLN
jgi:ubiquinone/menaquinone biosynthesis C-methylase UbiE